jgi:hypothetical protein
LWAHDETLGEFLAELRRRLGARRGAPRRPGKIKLDVPRTISGEFARAFDVRLVEQTTASWQFYFGLLERFVEREGHALIPDNTREDGYLLGSWANRQRFRRAQGELDPDRERQLEVLPGWAWDTRQAWWTEGLAYLQQFVERNGHAQVSQTHLEEGYPLGQWAAVQRRFHRLGPLSNERVQRLEAVRGWTWDPNETAWEEGFSHLRNFAEREGHTRVRQRARVEDYPLGNWAINARRTEKDRSLGSASAGLKRCPAGPGPQTRTPGRKGSPVFKATRCVKGTPGFRSLIAIATDSGSAIGSPSNDGNEQPLVMSALVDWSHCPVGRGIRARPPGTTSSPVC